LKLNKYFEGFYFKHRIGNDTVAFIPGCSNDAAFIQMITNNTSHNFIYPLKEYVKGEIIKIGGCEFSKTGIRIDIQKDRMNITGQIRYTDLTPIKYDIMGFFKYFPMECRHGIVSMHHRLEGELCINGDLINFTGGTGYIEKDSGTSFPKTYSWIQCSDFEEKCSVVVSVADIPFMGMHFKGCICVVCHRNKEYRIATYLGVKIIRCDDKTIILKQGKYRLEINLSDYDAQKLLAPVRGDMTRTIHESAACPAQFRFFIKNHPLFDFKSPGASFEYMA